MSGPTISAIVSALISTEPGPSAFPLLDAGGADPRFEVTTTPCLQQLSPREIDGETVRCGRVSVPEDHDDPEARRIDLAFIVFKSFSRVPAPDPVVYLHGGPGGGTIGNIADEAELFSALRDRRDIVSFDQRGVDASGGATRCYQAIAEFYPRIIDVPEWETLPDVLTGDLVADCIAELEGNGVGVAQYNTVQNARDVPALMGALGYDSYNIYGISYGTRLGLEVMRSAPDGLRSIVLDSVWPADIPFYDRMGVPWEEAIDGIFAQCADQPACAEAYPDLEARFHALAEALDAEPLPSAVGPISGASLHGILMARNDLGRVPPGTTSFAPLMVSLLEQGDPGLFEALARFEAGVPPSGDALLSQAWHLSSTERTLARLALEIEADLDAESSMAGMVLAELEAARNEARSDFPLVAAFRNLATQSSDRLRDTRPDLHKAEGTALLGLRGRAPDRAALKEVIRIGNDGATLERLTALIDAMTEEELAVLFDGFITRNRHIDRRLTELFDQMLFSCQEDRAINSEAGLRETTGTLRMVESMRQQAYDTAMTLWRHCGHFDPIDLPGFHEPVESDIPALVLTGLNDTQTAASWGPHAARTLSRAQVAVLPEAGHAVAAFSPCARDMGAAFIEAPTRPIDMGCVAEETPTFVLP